MRLRLQNLQTDYINHADYISVHQYHVLIFFAMRVARHAKEQIYIHHLINIVSKYIAPVDCAVHATRIAKK